MWKRLTDRVNERELLSGFGESRQRKRTALRVISQDKSHRTCTGTLGIAGGIAGAWQPLSLRVMFHAIDFRSGPGSHPDVRQRASGSTSIHDTSVAVESWSGPSRPAGQRPARRARHPSARMAALPLCHPHSGLTSGRH